ncbi:MAG TPA: UrcA family protein [Steroidobacteraceae bacterium]|jgi:UrcA family protein
MKNAVSPNHVVVSRPNITLLMVLCGIVSAAAAGAVSAATPDDDVPRLVVRYNAQSLATESGARALYRRLVSAAAQVCPTPTTGPFVSSTILHCREQSIARAVQQIDNPRLAAVYATSTKHG